MNEKVFHRTEPIEREGGQLRSVILHFHIFKNAGSTVDSILSTSFPGGWANYDGPVPEFFIHQSEMEIIARNRAQLKAISSHQIRLPLPVSSVVEFLPIVFIRRPELRIASIWRFQRQREDDHPATLLARQLDLKDWVARCLEPGAPVSIKNNQTHLFSFQYDQRVKANDPEALSRAIKNVDSIPFVGVVEEFKKSMKIYEKIYSLRSPDFKFKEVEPSNVTESINESVEEKLNFLKNKLGSNLFFELQNQNKMDIFLYDYCLDLLVKN